MSRAALSGLCLLLALGPAAAHAAGQHGSDQTVETAGDAMQFGVPLIALGLTFLLDDASCDAEQLAAAGPYAGRLGLDSGWLHMNGSPRHDLMLAIGRTELATYTLKYSVDEQRPNGGGQSFPSGHTSVAFAGAEFIRKEYGWGYGVPAYLAASFVGWSRVESHNHWTHDVLAGAAIGILSNHDGLSFQIPFGERRLDLSVSPTLMFASQPGLNAAGFDEPAPLDALEQAPAPGLHFTLRF